MKLRTHLFLLVAGTAIPLVALAAVLAYFLLEHENDLFRTGAQDRNRAFVSAVDAQLRGHIATLQALAALPSLEKGDLRTFHAQLSGVVAGQPDWTGLILSDPDGHQLVNTGRRFGEPLGDNAETVSFQKVVATRAPAIGALTPGPQGRWAVPVRVPVVQGDNVRYVLTAPIRPEAFQRLIQEQHFPFGWAAALLDSQRRFVARVPQRPAGEYASPDFQRAVVSGREGWFHGQTLEGVDTYTAYETSPWSGWTSGIAIPSSVLFAGAYRTTTGMLIGGLVSTALAIAFAWWMGRRIAMPISALAADARALATGRSGERLTSRIDEVQEVAQAFDEAGSAIRDRESLRDREETALKAADRAKDEFLAMLGHELRNPLSAISASAHVLRLSKPGENRVVEAHNVIDRQTRHMTRLVEDLLDVSRLAMGKVSLQPESTDLAELARRVAETWQQARAPRGDRVELMLSPAWVSVDRSRMEQVITNLLDNADKFSPADTAIALRVAAEGADVLMEVSDSGEGIPAQMRERIFEAFVQGPQDMSRSRGGIGLGLTLVRRLVELHGGLVRVASDGVGKGARFVVRLPRAEPPQRIDMPRSAPTKGAGMHRILLVEDNDDARTMLDAMLRLEGHEVRLARDGAGAMATAQQWRPDLAIVDIGLPDFDGHEVARRLRRAGFDGLKLVALSGYGQPEDERRAYESGFDLYLVKPVAPDLLRVVLDGLASGARTRQVAG